MIAGSGHQKVRAQEIQIVQPGTMTKIKGWKKGGTQQRAPSPTKRQHTPNSESNQTGTSTSGKGGRLSVLRFFSTKKDDSDQVCMSFSPHRR